jgi:hypothetical protein
MTTKGRISFSAALGFSFFHFAQFQVQQPYCCSIYNLLPSARLKILAVVFQINPAHAASAAIFTLLEQVETFKFRTTQPFEKRS